MKNKKAMSTIGYAIICVIILGIIMIISAPMIIDSNKNKNKNNPNNPPNQEESSDYEPYSSDNSNINVVEEMQNIESRLNSRISDIEARQNNQPQQNYSNNYSSNNNSEITNKYICTMEGTLDKDNNVIPLNSQQPSTSLQNQKIVFVCEFRN